MFLRSIGISGVVVVLFSTLAALTLLPALLGILGGRIECLRLRRRNVSSVRSRDTGFWSILAGWVMARPFLVLIPTLGVLLGLGTPFLRVNLSSPDATILPTDLPSRQGFDILTEAFGPGEISPLVIAVQSPSSIYTAENLRAIYDLERWLMRDPRINRTRSVVSAGPQIGRESISRFVAVQRGIGVLGVDTGLERFASDRGALILAFTFFLPNDPESKALLRDVRAYELGGDLTMLVDGSTAEIVDVVDAMYADVPATIALIVGTTYLLLLVLFRSVLLPLKAILMNALSIVASYGALVFIFQDGHFSDVLQFAPLGFVEASLPVIMFCVLFGLSMDYEVFLLTRIREEWERTGDNTHSVAVGLQRSGQIITSAALVVVVVTASFVSAQVILIKALGLGIALAVLLDATIVRALLVPATMRLLGRWNWWFPTRLGRVEPGGDISSSAID
jgi:RND superfamily putative drug exporter